MKHTTHFVSTRLVSLVLSLFLVFGTAASSLSAVTDQVVAAVKEPVRSAIPDAPAPVQATDETDIPTQSDSSVADYGVAEGSMLEAPADDDVLDIDLQSSDEQPAETAVIQKEEVDLAQTAALSEAAPLAAESDDIAATGDIQQVTDLPLMDGDIVGSATSEYYLEESGSGWKITNGSKYLKIDFSSIKFEDTGSIFTVEVSGNTFIFSGKDGRDNSVYLQYNNGFSGSSTQKSVSVYRTIVTYTVTFDPNGGSGTMANQTITGAGSLNANAFKHSKYSFESWNTKADGTGEVYANEGIVNFKKDTTLYAQWNSKKTFYFSNNKSWASVYAYMWKDGVDNIAKAAWPGDKLSEISKNAYGDGIFSVTVDLEKYDRIIFNNGTDGNTDGSKTETISVSADMNTGIYCGDTISDHAYNIFTYPYPVNYTKQIEKLNNDPDDYNYKLHLTVDGGALHGETETTPGQSKKQKVALIIDATETMTSTSLSGSNAGENKFQTIQRILKQNGGFLEKYLDGNNEVAVIFVAGVAGNQVSYTQCFNIGLNKTTDLTAARGNWSEQHYAHGISYTTAFLAAQDVFDPQKTGEEYSIVFFAGNAPQTYVNINTTSTEFGLTEEQIKEKNKSDCKNFLDSHPNVTFYGVGVSSQSGDIEHGSAELKELSEYSCGEYYNATTVDILTDQLIDIVERILPDKTTNLTVTDVLSDNVVLADTPYLSATLYTNPSNGIYQTQSTAITPTVSEDGKTITYTNPGTITGPYKLEITFDIKTADNVFMDTVKYPGTGYPDTGDESTDFGNNNTSSGQSGYYSNANATLSYTLNGVQSTMTFAKPVVQAPVQGKYIFKYTDRYGVERTVEVPVKLNSREKAGYSGNNGQPGVPTFLWTADAKTLFPNNPLVTAALRVDGNAELEDGEAQKDVSVYKHTIEWDNLNTATYTEDSNVSYDSENHTVTVTANTPEMTFTFNYKIMKNGKVVNEAATQIPYGRAVTFHSQYNDTSKYAYIKDTIPSEGFSYWSADEAGNIPITTNLTFGMLIRGDYMHDGDDETIVTVYAQYNKTPAKDWNPLIEEAKLTHTIEDKEGSKIDWLYLDYMTNYLSKDGSVVKDMIEAGNNNIRYGLIAVKHDGTATPDQAKMIKIAKAMITKDKQSAYLDSAKKTIAYRYEYGNPNDDVKPISNFNRVLYTLHTDTEKAENHTFSAIAYITVDGTNYFYSEVNSDIVVHDLIEN